MKRKLIIRCTSFVFVMLFTSIGSQPVAALETCGNEMEFLTHGPMNIDNVGNVVPIGSVNGSDHIVPIHINYVNGKAVNGVPVFPLDLVFMPGTMEVTAIEWRNTFGEDDWHINFRPCNEVRFYYHHLLSIVHPLLITRAQEIKSGINAWCDDDINPGLCAGLVGISVPGGEQLGVGTNNNFSGINFVAMDSRFPVNFVNPERYRLDLNEIPDPVFQTIPQALYDEIEPSRLFTQCTLNYYGAALNTLWSSRLASYFGVPGSNTPKCGVMNWDDPNSIQGTWFLSSGGENDWFFDEGNAVALIRDTVTPSVNIFSLGDIAIPDSPGQVLTFIPETYAGGTVNRDFKEVGKIGEVYCWQRLLLHKPGFKPLEAGNPPIWQNGIVIARKNIDGTIKVEYKDSVSSCGATNTMFTANAATLKK